MITGVFTTIKVKNSIPLFLDKHKIRLFSHAGALKIKPFSNLDGKIKTYLQKNNLTDCALRVVINNKRKIIIENRQLPVASISPISLISLPDTRDKNKVYKTTNRIVNEQAKRFAEKNSADDTIFVNSKKLVESTISNIFSLNNKRELITPNLNGKGLNGIARQIIMEHAKVIEQNISENTTAPLVLVNSLRIQKVSYLNGKKIKDADKLFQKIKTILEKAEQEYLQITPDSTRVYYKIISNWLDPELVFTKLFSAFSQSFWLDSSLTNTTSRFSYMGTSTKIYSYILKDSPARNASHNDAGGRTNEDIFSFLNQKLTKNKIQKAKLPFPFIGGYVGYFGYELKKLIGAKTKYRSSYPDSLWYFVDKFIAFDHKEKKVYLVCLTENKTEADEWFNEIQKKLSSRATDKESRDLILMSHFYKKDSSASVGMTKYLPFKLSRSKKQYLKDIRMCKEYLLKGESYQICLTNTLTTKINIDPLSLYLTLRKINPAPYSAYIKYNDLAILSSSPEEFLKIESGFVETKPIKGTIKRGVTIEKDKKLIRQLLESKKDWSENAMIVDLLRNDLGKVCEFGSVKVDKLMVIESYKTVHQLVSTVKGKLKKDASIIDCIKACFPGGSMTGAPKIRTMEILEELEKKSRGIYSGNIGFLSFNQTAMFNIVIRTIIMQKNKLEIGAGGAILIDSEAEKEYDEMILKTKALMNAVKKVAKTHTVFLALGSNIGDKKQYINDAVKLLQKNIKQITKAKLYETKPMYYENQNNFINTVLKGRTNLSPEDLLRFIKQIEKEIGRKKRFRNGPREIDIDILFYDDLVLKNKDIQIPHPGIQERDFVLKPFMDIDPQFTHPVLKKNIKELFNKN